MEFGGNSGIVLSFPIGKPNSLTGTKGGNEEKLFYKESHLGNLCEAGRGNEREFLFQLYSRLLYVEFENVRGDIIKNKIIYVNGHTFIHTFINICA